MRNNRESFNLKKGLQAFGLKGFREGQKEVIESVLQGKDTLVIMPTGGGKSLCYQLPAVLMEGITLVVSPLISLMQDQVQILESKGIAATMINSLLSTTEQNQRIRTLTEGKYKLVYISPERFRSERFLNALNQVQISFFAIDEAHCLSQWGHDFRPDYLFLGKAIEKLGRPSIGAFTATATPVVREDILQYLQLKDPAIFISGFSRPNLSLRILQTEKKADKLSHLSKLIEEQKTGIVYCATRKRVEEVSSKLVEWDIAHIAYHAGLSDEGRKYAQESFMQKEVDIAIATNAFGMGIDRADIRFVAPFEMPGSIEAYYQEVGRAGRDGKDSICELYFNLADKQIQEFFIEGANPSPHIIRKLYSFLLQNANKQHELYLSIQNIAEYLGKGAHEMAISSSLAMLSRMNVIERFDIVGQRIRGTRLLCPHLPPEKLPLNEEEIQKKEERDMAKLKAMIRFGYSKTCRQVQILDYFGEKGGDPCGHCDCCNKDFSKTSTNIEKEYRIPTEKEKIIVQKALSGIARMSWKSESGWIGRFGKMKIILMLVGSTRQSILHTGLDRLSTYGLLKEQGEAYLRSLFQEMERMGLIKTQGDNEYPLLTLTEEGEAVMRNQLEYTLRWPHFNPNEKTNSLKQIEKTSDKGDTIQINEEDSLNQALLTALRNKRKELAEAHSKPQYMILTNKALEELVRIKPKTKEDSMHIPGIGAYKARTVMPVFLKVIQTICDTKSNSA